MGRQEKRIKDLVEKHQEKNYSENLGVDGGIILKWIFKKRTGGGMDWINLAQNRDRWRALVNAAMKLRIP